MANVSLTLNQTCVGGGNPIPTLHGRVIVDPMVTAWGAGGVNSSGGMPSTVSEPLLVDVPWAVNATHVYEPENQTNLRELYVL